MSSLPADTALRYKPRIIFYGVFANDFVKELEAFPRTLSLAARSIDGDTDLFLEELSWNYQVRRFIRAITNPFLSIQVLKTHVMSKRFPFYGDKVHWHDSHGHYFQFFRKEFWGPFLDYGLISTRLVVGHLINYINEAKRFAHDNNIELVVLLLPPKEMVYGPLDNNLDVYQRSYEETYHQIEMKLRNHFITFLNLTSHLRQEAQSGRKLYFSIDTHFDESGHEAVAQYLTHFIKRVRAVANESCSLRG